MTTPRRNLDLWPFALALLIAAGVAAAFQMPRVFGDPERQTPEYAANRDRIVAMTEAEREQLKRRSERYHNLDEADREAIRDLHDDLHDAPNADRLKSVMQKYNEWLTSLSPRELQNLRDELSKAGSTEEKSQIVKDLRESKSADEQLVATLSRQNRAAYYLERDPVKRRKLLERFRLSSEDGQSPRFPYRRPTPLDSQQLEDVVRLIAELIPLTDEQKAELSREEPTTRNVHTMMLALRWQKELRDEHEKNENGGRGRRFQSSLSDSELKGPIEDSSLDAELKDRLLKAMRGRDGALSLIFFSILAENGRERGNPTKEQLNEFFTSLPREDQDELLSLDSSEMKGRLTWRYRTSAPYYLEFHELFRDHVRGGNRRWSGRGGRNPGPKSDDGRKRRPDRRGSGKEGRRGGPGRGPQGP